jgi:hypothetical protein
LTQLGEFTTRVRLYKALGGGLNQTAPSAPELLTQKKPAANLFPKK